MTAFLTSIGAKLAGLALVAALIGGLWLDNMALRADAKASAAQMLENNKECQLDAQTAAATANAVTAQQLAQANAQRNAAESRLYGLRAQLQAQGVVAIMRSPRKPGCRGRMPRQRRC